MKGEELWERSMNGEDGCMLEVRVEDGIDGEERFEMLMGDVVENGREFMEENGVYVKVDL